ncbi:hypothetical protein [Methylobacterium nigriterrae]|uniref:hypothetical protein n=1 Tax=Methylobacterium nigriterrae TaxID=3127512 RepID=UPI003013F79A
MKLMLRWIGMMCGGPRGDRVVVFWWNRVPAPYRYWGHRKDWSNGPLSRFGLRFGEVIWRLPWTNHDGGIRTTGWVLNRAWVRR